MSDLTYEKIGGKVLTAQWFQIFAVAFAAFACGFGLCNAIWVFFSPQNKCKNRDNETTKTKHNRQDG